MDAMNPRPFRRLLKENVERIAGVRLFRRLPRGIDLFYDLRRLMPGFIPRMIFDVGANVGQSTKDFLTHFPKAQIYCFEPVSSTFAALQRNVAGYQNVRCFQQALGSENGRAMMTLHADSELNVLSQNGRSVGGEATGTEEVTVETLTSYCRREGVHRIDLLKIDAEGQDLKVLEGATELFDDACIGIVQLEAGMNRTNDLHVPFRALVDFMETRGYLLFGIYEQLHEWRTGQPQLRRSNPVFFSERAISAARTNHERS